MYDDNQIRTCPNNLKFTVCLKVVDTPVLPMLAVSPELPHNQRLQEAPGAAEKLGCLPAWSDRQQKSHSEDTEDTEKKDERWWKAVKSNKGYIYILVWLYIVLILFWYVFGLCDVWRLLSFLTVIAWKLGFHRVAKELRRTARWQV
jgi:hypothetical protein